MKWSEWRFKQVKRQNELLVRDVNVLVFTLVVAIVVIIGLSIALISERTFDRGCHVPRHEMLERTQTGVDAYEWEEQQDWDGDGQPDPASRA